MNIVIAPDSFKGSLSSTEAARSMRAAVLEVVKDCNVVIKPMADGGEGTLDSLLTSSNGVRVPMKCRGPLGQKIDTFYAIVDEEIAIIECASIAGLTQVPDAKKNPDATTSFGIGEVILDALDQGCTSIVLGLGGSATNDGGLGMLLALGMTAWDGQGKKLGPYGRDLLNVRNVSFAKLDSRLSNVSIKVACDVDNPLCGDKGASAVYGPQKGASADQINQYDNALNYYGMVVESQVARRFKDTPGAGAAGGIGFALLAIGAHLVSGAELIAGAANLEKFIKRADLVITGEGQSDEQTFYGKAPGYIATLAKKYDVPVVLISGSLQGNLDVLRDKFAGCFSIITKPMSLEESMGNAGDLLFEQTKQVVHFFNLTKG